MLVAGTGRSTVFGEAAAALATNQDSSPFQRDLHSFGLMVARLTIALIVVVLVDTSDAFAALVMFGADTLSSPPDNTLLALYKPLCDVNVALPTTSIALPTSDS